MSGFFCADVSRMSSNLAAESKKYERRAKDLSRQVRDFAGGGWHDGGGFSQLGTGRLCGRVEQATHPSGWGCGCVALLAPTSSRRWLLIGYLPIHLIAGGAPCVACTVVAPTLSPARRSLAGAD
jgi:hypothetical protein